MKAIARFRGGKEMPVFVEASFRGRDEFAKVEREAGDRVPMLVLREKGDSHVRVTLRLDDFIKYASESHGADSFESQISSG